MARHEAKCLCKHIKQFKFVCSVVIWHDIINRINPVSKLLQKINVDISTAMQILENVLLYLKELRSNSDEGFNKFIFYATELGKEINVYLIFDFSIGRIEAQRVKQNFTYEKV
uniref:Uncharacterized protein n=1 Tax=Schizaphis graminum TaxID=13262 RepID=A0A2S2P7T7_SCHGA